MYDQNPPIERMKGNKNCKMHSMSSTTRFLSTFMILAVLVLSPNYVHGIRTVIQTQYGSVRGVHDPKTNITVLCILAYYYTGYCHCFCDYLSCLRLYSFCCCPNYGSSLKPLRYKLTFLSFINLICV